VINSLSPVRFHDTGWYIPAAGNWGHLGEVNDEQEKWVSPLFHKGVVLVKNKCLQSTQNHKNPIFTPQSLLQSNLSTLEFSKIGHRYPDFGHFLKRFPQGLNFNLLAPVSTHI